MMIATESFWTNYNKWHFSNNIFLFRQFRNINKLTLDRECLWIVSLEDKKKTLITEAGIFGGDRRFGCCHPACNLQELSTQLKLRLHLLKLLIVRISRLKLQGSQWSVRYNHMWKPFTFLRGQELKETRPFILSTKPFRLRSRENLSRINLLDVQPLISFVGISRNQPQICQNNWTRTA